jgi:DNA polymerase-3 subunit chi
VQIDFYQLADIPAEQVIASLSEKVLEADGRLLIVADDEGFLARLDRVLWDQGASGLEDSRIGWRASSAPPASPCGRKLDAPNQARNMLIADGTWREAALTYDRSFYLFDDSTLEEARLAWKLLAGREGIERRYWAREGDKWVKKA